MKDDTFYILWYVKLHLYMDLMECGINTNTIQCLLSCFFLFFKKCSCKVGWLKLFSTVTVFSLSRRNLYKKQIQSVS
jgi:hypothetical protein